jgi:hypothetical protein
VVGRKGIRTSARFLVPITLDVELLLWKTPRVTMLSPVALD